MSPCGQRLADSCITQQHSIQGFLSFVYSGSHRYLGMLRSFSVDPTTTKVQHHVGRLQLYLDTNADYITMPKIRPNPLKLP